MAAAKAALLVESRLLKRASEFLGAVGATEGFWFYKGQIVALGGTIHGRYAIETIDHPPFFMELSVYNKMHRLADELAFYAKVDGVIECKAGRSKVTLKPREIPTRRLESAAAIQIPQEHLPVTPVQVETMFSFAESRKSAMVNYIGGWLLATDSSSLGTAYVGGGGSVPDVSIPAILFKRFDENMLMHVVGEFASVSCDKRGVVETTCKPVVPSIYAATRFLDTSGETPSAVVWRTPVYETLKSFSGAEEGELFLSSGEGCLNFKVNFRSSEIEDVVGASVNQPVDVIIHLDSILSYFREMPDDAYIALTQGEGYIRLQANSETTANLPMAVMSVRAK